MVVVCGSVHKKKTKKKNILVSEKFKIDSFSLGWDRSGKVMPLI